jgi:hypothetical protein
MLGHNLTIFKLRAREFTKTRFGSWSNLAVKCALSCVMIWVLVVLLGLMKLWYKTHPAERTTGHSSPESGGANQVSGMTAQKIQTFWPQFFGSDGAPAQEMSMNGVEVVNQGWETTVQPADIIDYYRVQMTARGWQDVTAETYQIQPESRNPDPGQNSLQDPQYVKKYSKTIDSSLILRRGVWSIHINAFPSDQGNGQTRVSICAAATPSLEDFITQLTASYKEDDAHGGRPLEIIRQNGGNSYRMTISTKSASPAQAFRDELANLGAQGWHPTLTMPSKQTRSGIFAWVTRGKQNAALSVTDSPQGGASVSFVEIAPE